MRHGPALTLFLSTCIIAAACGRGGGVAAPAPIAPVSLEARVFYDDDVGIRDSTTMVIRSRAELDEAWRRIGAAGSTRPPLEQMTELAGVDFNRQMLVLVAAGRMQRGDEIQVDSVGRRTEFDDGGRSQQALVVQFRITEACQRFPDTAYPLAIVRVTRFDGPVRFVGRRERAPNCR